MPNTPAHVEGVTDLHDATANLIDPTRSLGFDGDGPKGKIAVREEEEGDGAVGWLVDEVFRCGE